MMQKNTVVASRRCSAAAYDVQVVDKTVGRQQFRLMFVLDQRSVTLVVSQDHVVRQLCFPRDEVGDDVQSFMAVQDPRKMAARALSSDLKQVLDESVLYAMVNHHLAVLHQQGILTAEVYDEHVQSLMHYQEAEDAGGLISYLRDEHLGDVADDSMLFKVCPVELAFWQKIWRSVVSKAGALDA
jgi:hypothetical protein